MTKDVTEETMTNKKQYTERVRLDTYRVDKNKIGKASGIWQLMQEAACHQMEAQKPSYSDLLAEGKALMLARVDLAIPEEIFLDEDLLASSWPCESSRATFLRNYTLQRCGEKPKGEEAATSEANAPSGEPLAGERQSKGEEPLTGEEKAARGEPAPRGGSAAIGRPVAIADTRWSLVDVESRKILKVSNADFSNYWIGEHKLLVGEKFKIPKETADSMREVGIKTVSYSDLDYNGHMNNTYYLDVLCDFIPELAAGTHRVSFVRIHYSKEAPLGDRLRVMSTEGVALSDEERKEYPVPAEKKYIFRTEKSNGELNIEAEITVTPIAAFAGKGI